MIDLKQGKLVLSNAAAQDDWLAARRLGIGASEIAACAGLSRRRGPWDVWSSKVNGTEFEPSDEMRWGQWIEGRIIDWWARETGRRIGNGGLFRSAEHPWMLATPDAVVLEQVDAGPGPGAYPPGTGAVRLVTDRACAVVDAKNAGWHTAADWEDGAPIEYIAQVTQQMLAVGVPRAYLVPAIGGKPPAEREFVLDEELAAGLIDAGSKLWQHVVDGTPPPLDGSASAKKWIAARYPDADPDNEAQLDAEDVRRLRDLIALHESMDSLKTMATHLENQIKERLGRSAVGVHGGVTYVTWKQINRAGYEVKPTSYRKFHIPAAIEKELGHGQH
jgi:putative phage-type endonuclease